MNRFSLLVCGLATFISLVIDARAEEKRPDLVFIIVDDLNDWLSCLDGHPEYDTTKQEPGRMIPSHQHPGLKVQDWFDKYQ